MVMDLGLKSDLNMHRAHTDNEKDSIGSAHVNRSSGTAKQGRREHCR